MSKPWPVNKQMQLGMAGSRVQPEWSQAWREFYGDEIIGPLLAAADMNKAIVWWNERARKMATAKRLRSNPRPLKVHAVRSAWTGMYWVAGCRVCGEQIQPYMPYGVTPGSTVFATAAAAGDEARTHLVKAHPEHPLVG